MSAAQNRCRAFKSWSRQQAKQDLHDHAADFYADVRDMFKKDILPDVRKHAGDISEEAWEKTKNGISSALDEVGSAVTGFIKVPINATANAGRTLISPFKKKQTDQPQP